MTDRAGVSPETGADPGVRRLVRAAFAASGALFGLLMYLLYLREPAAGAPAWTARIPGVNAAFNALTTALVCLGLLAIRAGRRRVHVGLMILALVSTGFFLAGYLTYHHYEGDTPYAGAFGPIYFPVLATHILASAAALPLLLTTVLLAASRRFAHHRRWARVTVPVWLYTSVTGLIVYAFLYG